MEEFSLKEAVVADVEYHPDGTGELLTIWLRLKDGKLVAIYPDGYRLRPMEQPWMEEFHGGNTSRKQSPIIDADKNIPVCDHPFFLEGKCTTCGHGIQEHYDPKY